MRTKRSKKTQQRVADQMSRLVKAARKTNKIQCAKAVKGGGGYVEGKALPIVCAAPNGSIRFFAKMPEWRW